MKETSIPNLSKALEIFRTIVLASPEPSLAQADHTVNMSAVDFRSSRTRKPYLYKNKKITCYVRLSNFTIIEENWKFYKLSPGEFPSRKNNKTLCSL